MSANQNNLVTKDSAFQGVLMNSVGWEIFHADGREVIALEDGNAVITLTEDELDLCRLAVKRVLGDIARGGQ